MEDILDIEVIADVEVEVENEVDVEIEIEQAGPAGKDGKSAYEVYLNNGGTLTETEWLDSLKGEPFTYEDFTEEQLQALTGPAGKDGKTPVKGEDYWTTEEQNAIKTDLETYINDQLGVIENGSY